MAAVFVAACVTVAHASFKWFGAIDTYAFMAVGNVAAQFWARADAAPHAAIVVRIDEQSFLTRYRERSPLDRCELGKQLRAIYDAQPHVVVIDLDLSPADWAQHEKQRDPEREADARKERACQDALERTIANSGADTGTVLMKPFDTFNLGVIDRVGQWKQRLDREREQGSQQGKKRKPILFGDVALPVSYGVTLGYFTGPDTLHGSVVQAAGRDIVSRPGQKPIDESAYTTGLKQVLTSWTDDFSDDGRTYTDKDLKDTLDALWRGVPVEDRIVFFGAGYGKEDTFLTPVGTLYGVEVHAAAFMSHSRHGGIYQYLASISVYAARTYEYAAKTIKVAFALALEVGIGLGFGMIILFFWQRYYVWRSDAVSVFDTLAPIWILAMLLGLSAAILFALFIAWVLLTFLDMWLSPIFVAIGMLIESFMVSPVHAAVERLHETKSSASPEFSTDSLLWISRGVTLGVWSLTLMGALILAMSH